MIFRRLQDSLLVSDYKNLVHLAAMSEAGSIGCSNNLPTHSVATRIMTNNQHKAAFPRNEPFRDNTLQQCVLLPAIRN